LLLILVLFLLISHSKENDFKVNYFKYPFTHDKNYFDAKINIDMQNKISL